MTTLRVHRSGPLVGRLRLPGDLHIGQEALLWAALANGPSLVSGLAARGEHRVLVEALRSMGVPIAETEHGYRVAGVGLRGLRMPPGALHARESRTTLEILTALIPAQSFGTRIEAEGSARERSLRTMIEPLRARGAMISGRIGDEGDTFAPVSVAPLFADEPLSEVEIAIPYGDPATKLALLVSGLYARGITAISEGMLSRDHTERALVALGVPVETMAGMTLLDTSELVPSWSGFEWAIPGDFGIAAFVIAMALAVPGSDVTLEGVSLNRSRTAFLEVMRHAGARIDVLPKGDTSGNEPLGDLRVRSGKLRATRVGGELAFRVLDEVPQLLAVAPCLAGRFSVRDVGVLRTRSPDPLRAASQLVRSFGAECTDYEDGFDLDAAGPLTASSVSARELGDLGWLALALGLSADGTTLIRDAEALDALYPGGVESLVWLGASIDREDAP